MTAGHRRVAAIDCGTNSVRLLIAEPSATGLREITRTMRIVRLGEGVDRTGRLSPAALARTGAALAEYRAMIDAADVGAVRMVATSAVRDAANRDAFDAMVERELGRRAEVVSGTVEAELSFHRSGHGCRDRPCDNRTAPFSWPTSAAGPPSWCTELRRGCGSTPRPASTSAACG